MTSRFVALLLALTAIRAWAASTPAQIAWQHRDQPGQTQAAIVAWQDQLQKSPQQVDLYVPLTKACGRAFRHSESNIERERWADLGREYGAKAVASTPTPEAYALYGEALGQWAKAHKGVRSLKTVRLAEQNLLKSVALDPKYAFTHMLLASFYENAPGWPVSIGNKKKALEHAKLAVEYGPTCAINHLTLAKIYLARDRKADAKKELEQTIALKAPADTVPETQADQETAMELLKKLEK